MYQGCKKYIPFTPVSLPDRTWPNNRIEKAPTWCSVDLRDGNQALVTPMNLQEKLDFFKLLVDIGFKEIEVGFPSASETEYEILRALIDGHYIPDDVTIQVLVQAREHLIRKTFEAVRGAKNVIIHFYNSTSTLQRKVVFKKDMQGIIDIAVAGAKLVRELTEADQSGTNFRYEYSPESFSGTEMDFAVDICHQVMETLGATKENPVILNLPNTVEMCTPNTYADQIEYFIRHLPNRDAAIISVHPHNDRGTGVACAELSMLAGADRVEGTLFGNGERTGNLDIVTVALNMFTQGVDPISPISTMSARFTSAAPRCTCPSAGRMRASWPSPPSPARIRTPSTRGMNTCANPRPRIGKFRICRSTPPMSAANTNRSSASTANPARAARRSSWITITATTCPRRCIRNLARLCRPNVTEPAAS